MNMYFFILSKSLSLTIPQMHASFTDTETDIMWPTTNQDRPLVHCGKINTKFVLVLTLTFLSNLDFKILF